MPEPTYHKTESHAEESYTEHREDDGWYFVRECDCGSFTEYGPYQTEEEAVEEHG